MKKKCFIITFKASKIKYYCRILNFKCNILSLIALVARGYGFNVCMRYILGCIRVFILGINTIEYGKITLHILLYWIVRSFLYVHWSDWDKIWHSRIACYSVRHVDTSARRKMISGEKRCQLPKQRKLSRN